MPNSQHAYPDPRRKADTRAPTIQRRLSVGRCGRIPGSDVNLGLATAFVVAVTMLLIFTDPSTPGTTDQWREARPEVQDAPVLVETGPPAVNIPTDGDCDVTVS